MRTSILRTSLLTLALAAGNAIALADDDKTQPPAPAKPETLRGPTVPDRNVPGVDNGLGTMQGGDKKGVAREMPIPHREFMRMLNEALGEAAPESVRLSAEQRTKVDTINHDFGEKQRTYTQTNKSEIDKLVAKYGPEVRQMAQRLMAARGGGSGGDAKRPGNGGGKPGNPGEKPSDKPAMDSPDGMKDETTGLSSEARAEVIAKLKELQANAPKPEDARTTIWGLLKAEQQAAVQVKVDAFKAEREKQQDERYKEREKKKLEERGAKKNPAAPASGTPGSPGKANRPGADAPAKPLDAAKRDELIKQLPDDLRQQLTQLPQQRQDRLLNRLNGIPADQREEAYTRIREMLKNGEGAGRPVKK